MDIQKSESKRLWDIPSSTVDRSFLFEFVLQLALFFLSSSTGRLLPEIAMTSAFIIVIDADEPNWYAAMQAMAVSNERLTNYCRFLRTKL